MNEYDVTSSHYEWAQQSDRNRFYFRERTGRWWIARYPSSCWPERVRSCSCVVCLGGEFDGADFMFADRLHQAAR